ncbi:hypothetical protein HN51_048244 [Arachis hypogaea]|nr:uncharacterized protein DS421_12g374730 [Arachis hypogaea]
MSSRRRSSAASEASSFASNRAYCDYSPSHYVRNTTTTKPSSSRSSKSFYATAASGSSFASNRAVRNFSPAVDSNRRFTSTPVVRTPPLSSISETGSGYSRLTSDSSADSVWSFASNRAVHNYDPTSTPIRNSNRLTRDPFRRSMGSYWHSTSSDFASNNLAVHGFERGSWHSTSSYNKPVASEPSFVSNRGVRRYAPPLSSTMNSRLLTSNGFVHSTTQLPNSDETGSRHTTTTYSNFIHSSEPLENPRNDSSHPTSDSRHCDLVSWPLDAGIDYSRLQTADSYARDPLLPKATNNI